MNRTPISRARFATTSSIAALALVTAMSAPRIASAAEDLLALYQDSTLYLQTLPQSVTPLTESANAADEGPAIAQKLVAFEANLDVIGNPSFGALVENSDDYQLNVSDTYNQAKLAYDTLLTRCEYMRDTAGPNATRVSERSIGLRLQALEKASQEAANPTLASGRASDTKAAEYLDAVDEMLSILQSENYSLGDPSSDTYQYSISDLHKAVEDIYSRVLLACPSIP